MVNKCCVPKCTSNYDSQTEKVSIYKLPKDKTKQQEWIRVIPRVNMPITKYTSVCARHWPPDVKLVSRYGKLVPDEPPSIFNDIPQSCLATPKLKRLKTTKACCSERNIIDDEMDLFISSDKRNFV